LSAPVDVAIVGGGLTGLVTALSVRENSDASIALLEAGSDLGGKIRTVRVGDVVVEAGADSFLARSPEGTELARRLGIDDELIAPDVFGALTSHDGNATRLPPGSVYGIPANVRSMLGATALTPAARIRALTEVLSPRKLRGPDVSVGDFVARRFGNQVVDRLVDPLLAGTRAGDVYDMSLGAALPQVDTVARRHRSLLLGLGSERRKGALDTGPPPFLKVRSGMSRLIEELSNRVAPEVDVRMNHPAELLRRAGTGFVLEGPEEVSARAVVFAAPAYAAASAVLPLDQDAAGLLGRIDYASVASVALVYPPKSFDAPPGISGVLVSGDPKATVAAITFYSQKWPQSGSTSDVLRCFVGRTGRHPALDLADKELVSAVTRDVRALCNVSVDPVETNVVRWERSLPQYSVGHNDRLRQIETRLLRLGPIFLAGAGYRGSGIPDCIRQGESAANRVLSFLKGG
jgi:protoporphyrinogen/coproporphyrinogen III oxidase